MNALILLLAMVAAESPAGDATAKKPTWHPVPAAEVKSQALAWLEAKKPDDATRAKAAAIWADLPEQPTDTELLSRLAGTFAVADKTAAGLVELCGKPRAALKLAPQPWLAEPKTPTLETANLRLLYGRWLAQEGLFDESLEQLTGLKPAEVVAPAMLLFYQGVVNQRLLHREAGLAAIDELLRGAAASPQRYVAVARLMQEDLKGLEEETLDHIARRMDDIHRRLDLGHGGPKVRKVEDGVIESLDKLIKKVEDQQKQQQAAAASSNSNQSNKPAQDSKIMGGKGPGEVTKKNIGSKSGWGDLPPKDREQAMQQIGRDFPSHYRDIVEQYFRKLATE